MLAYTPEVSEREAAAPEVIEPLDVLEDSGCRGVACYYKLPMLTSHGYEARSERCSKPSYCGGNPPCRRFEFASVMTKARARRAKT